MKIIMALCVGLLGAGCNEKIETPGVVTSIRVLCEDVTKTEGGSSGATGAVIGGLFLGPVGAIAGGLASREDGKRVITAKVVGVRLSVKTADGVNVFHYGRYDGESSIALLAVGDRVVLWRYTEKHRWNIDLHAGER